MSNRDVAVRLCDEGWQPRPSGGGIEQRRYVLDENEYHYLNAVYEAEDPFATKDFLKEHPFVARLLVDAYPRLRSRFGKQAQVVLQLVEEPETARSYELFAVVRTSMMAQDAVVAMQDFDEDWWLAHAHEARGRLNFDTECV